MSHVDSGPLASYNSLQDKHLVGYFNNTRMRRHLRRSGLITRNGEIVTENTFRLNMARREHQKHVRDLMAQAIVHKALDMERHRQAEIKKKLEEISKVELVQRVRSTRGRKGDEDITPYLSPRAPSGRPKSAKQERPRSVVSGHRPSTAPSKHSGATKKKSAICVDKEGFPVHRDQAWGASDDASDEIDSHNLRELDPYVLNNITLNMSPEEKQSNSPYKVDLTLPEPKPPPHAPQGSRKSPRGTSRTTRTIITRDGRRIRPKSNKGSLSLHRKEPAYPHPTQQQTLCDVTVRYRGNNLKLQYERQDKRDEIIINQQHCGGENLVVFHGLVEPGTDLVFTSRRHRGYPFSLTFYVNQIQVLRLSACCEYKYGPGVLLGGRKGHFKFGRVDGGSPCYRCMVEAELARRERQRYKDTQTEEPKSEPKPEPILENQGTQSDPPPPETKDQVEQAEAGEDVQAEAYDDDDFEDEDDKEAADSEKETPKAEKSSDHFFSGPESDAEQKQPQEADYGVDSDFEADSNHEKQDEEKESEREREEADEILEEEEVKDGNIPDEISKEEPVGETAHDGVSEEVREAQEVPEEQKEKLSIPEASQQTDDDKDEPQKSRGDDSDSSSDSEGDNRVLSSSSSSSSSSEDEADQKTSKSVQETAPSSSDFSSEDEGRAKEAGDQVKQEDNKVEEPATDDKIASDTEKKDAKEEDAERSLDEEVAQTNDDDSGRRAEDDDKEGEQRSQSPPASEKRDAPETVENEHEVQDRPSDRDNDEVKDTDTDKAASLVAEEEEKQDEKQDETGDNKDKDKQIGENEEKEKGKSFLKKLADKVKDALTSSSSDSSDSDSDEGKEKKKRRKRKTKRQSSSSEEEKSKKSESDSDSDKDKKKSFFEKLKDKFTSSDSDSESDLDKEKKRKRKKEKSKSENRDDANKDALSKDADQNTGPEIKAPEPVNDEEEGRKSLKDEKEKKSETEEGNVPGIPPTEEKEKEKGWIDKMEERVKGLFGSSDSEDKNKKTEDAKKAKDETKAPQEEVTAPKEEEEKGWIDKMEDKIKAVSGSSDSEDDGDGGKTKKVEQEISAEAAVETGAVPSIQEEKEKSAEPPQEEREEEKSGIDEESKGHDMFGPSDSDSKDDDDDDKPEDTEETIKAEEDAETGAVPLMQEEKPRSSGPPDDFQMQSENEDGRENGDNGSLASLGKDLAQGDKDDNVTQSRDDAFKKAGDEGNEEEGNKDKAEEKEVQEMGVSGDEVGASPQEEIEPKHEEPRDEDDGKEEMQREDDVKGERQDDGSMSSRSSVSESGSIAAGLDKDFRVLNLNDKNLDESKAARLSKALKHRKYRNLEYLLLRGNPLSDPGIASIIRSLIEIHNAATSADSALKLTHLDLGSSGMGDEAAAELSKLLTLDTHLRNLNISENALSATAWEALIEGLKANKSLLTFSAEYAHLSDTSCVMLTDGVVDHERLEELNVEGNSLGERAGNALAQLVKDNSIIITVNLKKDNSISPRILKEIKEILETGSYVP